MSTGVVPAVPLAVLVASGAFLLALAGFVALRWEGSGSVTLSAFAVVLGTGGVLVGVLGLAWGVPRSAILSGGFETDVSLWATTLNSVLVGATIPWIGYVLWYTGQRENLDVGTVGLVVGTVPIGVLLVNLWVSFLLGRRVVDVLPVGLSFIAGAATIVSLLYWMAVHLAGVVAVVRTAYLYDYLETSQGVFLGIAASGYFVGNVLSESFATTAESPQIEPFVGILGVGFLGSGLALAVAIFRYDALGWTPAAGNVGRATVLEQIDDLVMVTDRKGVVVEVNRTAADRLGSAKRDLLGKDLSEVLGVGAGDLAPLESVALRTTAGTREFDAEVSELTDHHETGLGHVVTLHDVTDRRIREQRIEVLNRVLRHNLRNKMSIVKGTAEYVTDGQVPPERIAESLDEVADDLVLLGEKAREIEGVIQNRDHVSEPIDPVDVVEDIVESTSEDFPWVTVRVDTEAVPSVQCDREQLAYAVENVVENAAEHNDADDPWVEVGVERHPETEGVRVTVADNGPGIPQNERTAVADGEESPLEHGSGLGLWATNWCVASVGGDLSFGDRDGDGSVVRIDLPQSRSAVAAPVAETPVRGSLDG